MLLSRKLCTILLRCLKTTSLAQPITINFIFNTITIFEVILLPGSILKHTKAYISSTNLTSSLCSSSRASSLKCFLWFFIYNYKFSSPPSIFNLWSLTAFHWSGSSTTLSGNITLSCGPDQIYKEINLKMEFVKVRITLWARNFYPFLPAKQQLLNWRPCRCTWRCGPGLWSGL